MSFLNKHTLVRRILFSFVLLLMLSQLMTSCLQFRMSPKEVNHYFEGTAGQPELKTVEVGKRQINFAFQDNDKPVTAVFIHGAPGSWSAFVDFMKIDSLRDAVNILSVDRPGYGYSGFGDAMISLEMQSDLLMEAIGSVADGNLILIGHSLGGPVAARMMMDYPKQVMAAVLVAPSIDPELEKREWYRYLGKLRLVKYMIPKSLWVTNEEIYDLKRELQAMEPGWEDIENPVIVIQGTKDNLVPKENADYAMKMLPDSLLDVELLEGVNHFIPWTHPHEITAAILKLAGEQSANFSK
mgnify:CR=1 FL=1